MDLCEKASEAWVSGLMLRLQLRKGGLAILNGPKASRRSFQGPITLDSFLSENQELNRRMTPKQQTILALDVAASLLQLSRTDWVGLSVTSQAVKIMQIDGAGMGSTGSANIEPFIEQPLHQRSPGPGTKHDGEPGPCLALLELAILLLEIWQHETLEQWASSSGTSIDTARQRHMAAIDWFREAERRLPIHYRKAIGKCLGHFSGESRSWGDLDFLEELCEDVIKPLQKVCSVW